MLDFHCYDYVYSKKVKNNKEREKIPLHHNEKYDV